MRSFLFFVGLRGGGAVSPRTFGFFGFFGVSAVLSHFFWIVFFCFFDFFLEFLQFRAFFKALIKPRFHLDFVNLLFIWTLLGGWFLRRTFGFFGISAVLSIFGGIAFLFFGFFGISAVSSRFFKALLKPRF